MKEEAEISIVGRWTDAGIECSPANRPSGPEIPGDGSEWISARRRIEIYLEALAFSSEQRSSLADRAIQLARAQASNAASAVQSAMSALRRIMSPADGDPLVLPPVGTPRTSYRSCAVPALSRGHMIPTDCAVPNKPHPSPNRSSSSGGLPFRFVYPPEL
ncbi:MAG: hypothetical protein V1816_05325 [Pseudomonadota bacterium]